VSGTDRSVTITAGQLRALHRKGNGADLKAGNAWGRFDLPAFLSRLGIAYERDVHEGADRYKLEHCPFNPEHGRGEAAVFQQPDARLGFRCQHNSCADRGWQDVRALVDGPRQTPGGTPHGTHQSTRPGNGAAPGGEEGAPADDSASSEESRLRSVDIYVLSGDPPTQRARPQTDILIDIGLNVSKALFCGGNDDNPYAVIRDCSEVWDIASRRFRKMVARLLLHSRRQRREREQRPGRR
jgi:hypothetical protein